MRKVLSLLMAFGLFMTLALNTTLAAGETATGEIKDKDGKSMGSATLAQNANGSVGLQVKFNNLPVGTHGIHFHAAGKCEGPDFASAGAHFNPDNHKHGLQNPDGGHAGDLPNLVVPAGGSGTFSASSTRITLSTGANQLIGQNGSALVIHAQPDDEKTDPTGNSGGRIACAVLTLQAAGQPSTLPASGLGSPLSTGNEPGWAILAGFGLMALLGVAGLLVLRRQAMRQ